MKIKAIRGMKDILPEHAAIWSDIEKEAIRLCRAYGYRRIRTPLLEEAQLFTRSIGRASDIVRKEMYSFPDRKRRILCLRPEATASVVRAYLEHNLEKSSNLVKFYYLGPMFRAERPQAGRLRQFHHIGVEAIGSSSPYLDAEVISLAVNIIKTVGINGFVLQLNSIGCHKDREKYKLGLKAALKNKLKSLCSDCHNRYKTNLLRIFDCKNITCKNTFRELPAIFDSLCAECREHFDQVKQILQSLNIAYLLNPYLVRGLDYYTKSCFEIIHPQLGAQNAIGAGGRYDNLVSDLGGPQTAACGFALGVERLIAALAPAGLKATAKSGLTVYIAASGEGARRQAFKLLQNLREQGIASEVDYQDKSLKGQMRQADRLGARFVAILGDQQLNKKTLILRDMQNKSQRQISLDKLAGALE